MLRWLNNLKIRTKLLLGVALLTAAIYGPTRYNLSVLVQTIQHRQTIVEGEAAFVRSLQSIRDSSYQLAVLTRDFKFDSRASSVEGTLAGDAKYTILAKIDQLIRDSDLDSLPTIVSENHHSVLRLLKNARNTYVASVLKLVELAGGRGVAKQTADASGELKVAEAGLEKVLVLAAQKSAETLSAAVASVDSILHASVMKYDLSSVVLLPFSAAFFFLLAFAITVPITRLTKKARSIAAGNLVELDTSHGHDEISVLTSSLNSMVEQIREANRKIVSTAKQAGMAEVATHVLHNIGNILNSANTSLHMIRDRLSHPPTMHLSALIAQLEEHKNSLTDYVMSDERGQHMLPFLAEMAEKNVSDREYLSSELQVLVKSLDLIKDVVASQQKLASSKGFVETFQIQEAMHDLSNVVSQAMSNAKIKFTTQISPSVGLVTTDKLKLQQLLFNLVTNAKDAVLSQDTDNRKVEVVVSSLADHMIKFSVIDNGMGFDEHTHKKLFSFSFSTKGESGNGFGLHFCALAATEMGGTISAFSQGPGQGATFEFTILNSRDMPGHPAHQ